MTRFRPQHPQHLPCPNSELTCQGLNSRPLKEAGRAAVIVPVCVRQVPAVVDVTVLTLDLQAVEVCGRQGAAHGGGWPPAPARGNVAGEGHLRATEPITHCILLTSCPRSAPLPTAKEWLFSQSIEISCQWERGSHDGEAEGPDAHGLRQEGGDALERHSRGRELQSLEPERDQGRKQRQPSVWFRTSSVNQGKAERRHGTPWAIKSINQSSFIPRFRKLF